MSFGLNRAQVIGRLGGDATIHDLANGGRVANLSIATDEGYVDKTTGDRRDRTEWHKVVTFQDGLITMLAKHARKGRLVYVEGKLQTRKWRDKEKDVDRYSTEIMLVPGGRVQFLDKPGGAPAPAANGEAQPPTAGNEAVQASGDGTQPPPAGNEAVPAADEIDDQIPF